MAKFLLFLPPVIFAALAATFYIGMLRQAPDELPSALIGQKFPSLPPAALADYPLLTAADLTSGQITVVNFWASWCPPCRAENPVLKQMTADGIRVVGINFKDKAADASAFLAKEGNAFMAVAFDPDGRVAIDWGVTAPPETFIIGGDGTVLFRFAGPLIGSYYQQKFIPALNAALAK